MAKQINTTNETPAPTNTTNETPAAAPAATTSTRFTKAMAMAIALSEGGGTPEEIGKRMNELMVAKGQKPIIDPHLDVKYVMAYFVGAGAIEVKDGKVLPYTAPAAETEGTDQAVNS